MEKSLLEQKLEMTLAELGMPLGERICADELKMQAEFEDLTTKIKSKAEYWKKILPQTRGEISNAQLDNDPFGNGFLRKSQIYRGLGISLTNFEANCEFLDFYYNPNIDCQIHINNKRY